MARARSGQITVTTAGTAVLGPTFPDAGGDKKIAFLLRAHPSNTGIVYIGNDGAGDTSSAAGFGMKATDPAIEVWVNSLADLAFDVSSNGEKICWIQKE